ncbi:MAG: hypothetical protein ACAF41_07340 [Leptolyngbya sp. BL-A-14]
MTTWHTCRITSIHRPTSDGAYTGRRGAWIEMMIIRIFGHRRRVKDEQNVLLSMRENTYAIH